jgi:hypothetical protein
MAADFLKRREDAGPAEAADGGLTVEADRLNGLTIKQLTEKFFLALKVLFRIAKQ